jgi:non-specific serine/threonine protein kinase
MLTALADKSLLRVDGTGRYDLHELLRQFAADKLAEAGETNTAAQKHQEYFVALAESGETHAYGREQVIWYDLQEAEMDNLRAALAWSLTNEEMEMGLRMAAALRWVWEMRGHLNEGADWFKKLLALSRYVSPLVRAKALHRACEVTNFVGGEALQARLWGEEALQLSRALNDPWNTAWSLSSCGFAGYHDEKIAEAAVQLDESLSLFRELDDPLGLSHALRRRAIVASYQGDFTYAQNLLDEALTRDRAAQDQNAIAWELSLMGMILWSHHHKPAPVIAVCQESIVVFRAIQDQAGTVLPLIILADVEQSQGNYGRAHTLYREALLIDQYLNLYGYTEIRALVSIGRMSLAQGQPERAARLLGAARYACTSGYGVAFLIDNFDEDIAIAHNLLDKEKFDTAWTQGQAMALKEAIVYALGSDSPVAATANENLLTEREIEILRLVADGLNSREIAEALVLSVGTVRWYIKEIYSKLDAHSRAQALARAKALKLLI